MDWYDAFFPAAKPLRIASGQQASSVPPAAPIAAPQGNAGIDMAAEAQKAAERMKAQQTPASPAGPLTKAVQKKRGK